MVPPRHIWNSFELVGETADGPMKDEIMMIKQDEGFTNDDQFLTVEGFMQLTHKLPLEQAVAIDAWYTAVFCPVFENGHGFVDLTGIFEAMPPIPASALPASALPCPLFHMETC